MKNQGSKVISCQKGGLRKWIGKSLEITPAQIPKRLDGGLTVLIRKTSTVHCCQRSCTWFCISIREFFQSKDFGYKNATNE